MSAKILVIVILPPKINILESDIAGRPVFDYLLESLNRCDEAEVRIAADGHTLPHVWLEKYPNISECRIAELQAAKQADDGLLVIDARAWLSHAAVMDIFTRTRQATNCLRIVEASKNIPSHREIMTLAVYFPPKQVRLKLFNRAYMSAKQMFEQILGSEALADENVINCFNLNALNPPLLIASYVDLALIERRLLLERAIAVMQQGVRIRDPGNIYIRGELVCGSDVAIEINVIIEGHVILGNGVRIGANSILRNSRIGENTSINPFSLVEHSTIGSNSFVGPYGRIRPGSVIGDDVQIGNYVEIKNSQVGAGSRINHHAFIGDAVLADQVTIGAGTITCNHDGVGVNQTVIGRGAYIGSGCNLVAPLRIGEDAVIGAGSTITRDVPAAKLTLTRQPQTTIDNWQGPKTRRKQQ